MLFANAASDMMELPVAPPAANRFAGDVAVGADDFLFHRFERVFEQLCGDAVPTDRQLTNWIDVVETSFAWCKAKNITYVTLIIPERHVAYSDKLPPDHAISPARPVKRLLAAIDPTMRAALLYPEIDLHDARQKADVYYRTDEHLNLHGSDACYRALASHLCPALTLDPLARETLGVHRVRASGSLGMRLSHEPMEDMETWKFGGDGRTRRIFSNRNNVRRVEVMQHVNRALPKAVIFGDSNIEELRHLLAPQFSRTVILYHAHRFFHDLVRTEHPDVVIHVMAESRLGGPCADGSVGPAEDFLEYCGERLPGASNILAVDFGERGDSCALLGEGWSYKEGPHRWMVGASSTLRLSDETALLLADALVEYEICLRLWPLTAGGADCQAQRLTVSYGHADCWMLLGSFEVEGLSELRMAFPPLRDRGSQDRFLKFDHPNGFAPTTGDARILSLAMIRLSIEPRS